MSANNFGFESGTFEHDEVDLGGVAAALGRNKGMIIGATLGAAAAALLFCSLVKPRYAAESSILVENQESYFTRADPDASRTSDAPQVLDAEAVNSQIQLLTSRDLARKAVQRLGLQGNPEFDPAAGGGNPLTRPFVLLGLLPDPSQQSLDDRILTKFNDHLTVMSPTKTRVLQVQFSSRDPDLAARGANVIADLYIDLQMQAKRESAHQAAETLKPHVAQLEAKVAEADARVEAFRVAHGLFDVRDGSTVSSQQLGEIATRVAEARAQQSDALAKAHSLRDLLRQGRLADAADISSNDLVRRVADQRVVVRNALAAESRTLLPGHPRIKELQAQLSDIETQLRAAVDKAARGLDNDARVAAQRVANLNALMDDQKKVVGVSGGEQAQLSELQRNDKTLKDQLASEAAKYQAALARDNADTAPADARIISRAMSPSVPVFPKKLPITIFAALAGLFFSVGGVTMRAMTATGAGAPRPVPPPREMGFSGARAPSRDAVAGASAAAASVRAEGKQNPARGESGARAEANSVSRVDRLKQAVAEFGAPAVQLDAAASQSCAPAPDVWVKADRGDGAARPSGRGGESGALIERIVAAAGHGGAKVVVASAPDSASACASLTLARSLVREGRVILVQTDDQDFDLRQGLQTAGGANEEDAQPGLAQLLSGEASFAEAIYRDAASRLHIVQAGGEVDSQLDDLGLIFDALQATYDFVLLATGAGAAARLLAGEADLTLIFAEDGRTRNFLYDDFEAAGVRRIVLAGVDRSGEIVEVAA